MLKSIFLCLQFCIIIFIEGLSQSSEQQPATSSANYIYHSPSSDKLSWQRLNLWLSCIFFRTSKQSSIDWDSSLLFVSRSLGLSRLSIIAEGIDDSELLTQSQWFNQQDPGKGIRLLSKAEGKKHLELMVLLGAYYAFQPDNYRRYKDSVEYFLNKANNESKLINEKGLGRVALCLLTKMYMQSADTAKGNIIFNALIDESKIAGDKKTEARGLAYRAIYTPALVNSQERIGYIQKATEIYHSLGDRESEIPLLVYTGYLYIRMARFDDAVSFFMKALQLENAIDYPYTHYTTDAVASVLMVQDKFGEPLKYALESIKTAEASRDSVGWAYFYSRLAGLYITEGERDEEATKWMMKAIERFARNKDANLYLTLYTLITSLKERERPREGFDLLLSLSKRVLPQYPLVWVYYDMCYAIAYSGMKQYKLAEQYAAAADSILKLPEVPSVLKSYIGSNVTFLFGSINFDNHQFGKAKTYFEQYLSNSSRAPLLKNEMSVYQGLIHIDSVFHDASSAVKHYERYVQLLDSNFRVSKLRQAEELQVMYQTQEKENQIVSLNQQAKLEQANLKQAMLVKNLTIAGIVAALIIAGLLYRQSRLRQKNNNVITRKNEQLQHLLTEKDWLVKEIHHRVKNNLQIVMSLLNSQSAYIDNEFALNAIQESQHRVHAMSLIHQKLYNADSLSSIDMSLYIRELVSYLADSFDTGQKIHFEYNIEPIEMDVSEAVPLGLILNEAITNSIKYAFPESRDGVISISLSSIDSDHCSLIISDNGIGIPLHLNNKKPGSLGMSLMQGLSEDLEGDFSIENKNGTTIKIAFVHYVSVKHPGVFSEPLASNN
jgi:two-component sensor histidine kinase/tetratricopeptide (TPR) repeat protein